MAEGRVRTERARGLRRRSQDAEWKLWKALQNRSLRGCKFRRQHPILGYYADFACVERHVVVELDGPGHSEQRRYDEQRTAELEGAGWIVIRFWNQELDDDGLGFVLQRIGDLLDLAAS